MIVLEINWKPHSGTSWAVVVLSLGSLCAKSLQWTAGCWCSQWGTKSKKVFVSATWDIYMRWWSRCDISTVEAVRQSTGAVWQGISAWWTDLFLPVCFMFCCRITQEWLQKIIEFCGLKYMLIDLTFCVMPRCLFVE